MGKKTQDSQRLKLSRRGLLAVGVALPASLIPTASPTAEPMPDMSPKPVNGGFPDIEGLETLTAIESDILEAVCARLIPTDDRGPGAQEARAAHYIDRALISALRKHRQAYADGLAALDVYSRTAKGKPFAQLAPADQDAVLHDLENNVATGFKPDSASFFILVRAHTIEGTFCDPYYGGNAGFVGWNLIGYPGLRMGVEPADQSLVKPEAVRESAYQGGMFGRGRS